MESFKLNSISAMRLAQLASPKFCPRCFWLQARLNFKLPWSMFPRIFNDIDLWQKAFVESYVKEYGVLPSWLKEYGEVEIVKIPGFGKFGANHECGIYVNGVTDHVFRRRENNKLVIMDYKTSRPTGDEWFPIYKVQLSVYDWIARKLGMGDVEQCMLIYYEPMTFEKEWRSNASFEDSASNETVSGMRLGFRPFVVKCEVQSIDQLILDAKTLLESEVMPKEREGCSECGRFLEMAKYRTQEWQEQLLTRLKHLEVYGCECDTTKNFVCPIHLPIQEIRTLLNLS